MRKFDKVIGTGGIGTGEIYKLAGDHTLGREESRAGQLLDNKDFCKLHIIFHYISVLARDMKLDIKILPVSAVGDDLRGEKILSQMTDAGIDVKYVKIIKNAPTLHSVCFQYPDGSGGNITESRSACSKVNRSLLMNAAGDIDNHTIIMAAPEVPLGSRIDFIKMGVERLAFIAASFNSSEIADIEQSGIIKYISLLSINMDEARTLAGLPDDQDTQIIVDTCLTKLIKFNPEIKVAITNGARGAYAYETDILEFSPVYPVKAVNTAGAGDAFLAGLIIGIIKGIPFADKTKDSCLKFATALASMSVTSKDTIHFGVSGDSLNAFINKL